MREPEERTTVVHTDSGSGVGVGMIAGILGVLAVVALVFFLFTGSGPVDGNPTASIETPSVNVESPDIDVNLPEAPNVDVNVPAAE